MMTRDRFLPISQKNFINIILPERIKSKKYFELIGKYFSQKEILREHLTFNITKEKQEINLWLLLTSHLSWL